MKVVYHAHTYFLDNSIELINVLKQYVDLYVFIEISTESAKSTIVNIDRKHLRGQITDLKEVLSEESWDKLEPYLSGVKSCKAILYGGKNNFAVGNIPTVKKLKEEIHAIDPDIVHFDTISNRCVWMYNSLRKYKLIATIHDPLPHSGEGSWKQNMSKHFFGRVADAYFFHSQFAEQLFAINNNLIAKKTFHIGMKPYSIIKKYDTNQRRRNEYILFFGRISNYKGIDILLEAIPEVHKQYPDEIFLIVGQSEWLAEKIREVSKNKNIRHINEYLNTKELTEIISNAKFVVCPYRDVTQSGVLMTSFVVK